MAYDDCYRKLMNSHYLEGKNCHEIYHALAKKVKNVLLINRYKFLLIITKLQQIQKKQVPAKCERRNWSKKSKNKFKDFIRGNPSNN